MRKWSCWGSTWLFCVTVECEKLINFLRSILIQDIMQDFQLFKGTLWKLRDKISSRSHKRVTIAIILISAASAVNIKVTKHPLRFSDLLPFHKLFFMFNNTCLSSVLSPQMALLFDTSFVLLLLHHHKSSTAACSRRSCFMTDRSSCTSILAGWVRRWGRTLLVFLLSTVVLGHWLHLHQLLVRTLLTHAHGAAAALRRLQVVATTVLLLLLLELGASFHYGFILSE